jgi:ribosomal protein L29
MKLNKDQKQKILLGAMLMIGVVYATNEFLLSPLAAERVQLAESMTQNEPKLREMRGQIARAKDLMLKAPEAKKTVKQVEAMIPEGAPIAWFPPRVADFFKQHGIDRVSAKQNNETPDKELAEFRKLSWAVELPSCDFLPFAAALAEFENAEPLFEVSGFDIASSREQPDSTRVSLTVQNLIKL